MTTPDRQPPTLFSSLPEGGFEPYLRAVRRFPATVVLIALAAVLATGVWLVVRPTHYQATAGVLLTPVPFDDATYAGLPVLRDTSADPTRATQTAAGVLDSPAAASAAAARLGPGWNAGRVRGAVTITPFPGSNVLAVTAQAGGAREAARVANAFVTAALAQRRRLLERQAAGLIAQLKGAPVVPKQQVARLLPLTHGFDPSFSLGHAAAAGTRTGRAAWRVLASVLFAGLVLGAGVAVLRDARARRRG